MIDLQPFCSINECRMGIMTPFAFNGWKYATDGRVCVRVKTDEPDDSGEPHKRPDASKLFAGFNVEGLQPFDIPPPKGLATNRCRYCNGNGVRTCDLGHDHDCDECDGTGEVEEWPSQDIGACRFSERYLSKIITLPGLKFYPTSAENPALFTFDGGEGTLAQMRKGAAQ